MNVKKFCVITVIFTAASFLDSSDAVKSLKEIYRNLRDIAAKDDAVNLFEIGKSYHGVPIYAVKIHERGFPNASTVVVEFGIHPREWASPASAMYLIRRLLREKGRLSKAVQWFLIPILNPDGYNYSTVVDDMWRKNRRPLSGECVGVDLNRNFDVAWETKRDEEKCSDEYAGHEPFSEPESLSARNLVETIGPKSIDAYVAVHTCAQSILHPYGHKQKAPNVKKLRRLKEAGHKMAEKMYKVRGKTYPVEQAATLGVSGGGSDDFMFEHYHIPLVYTLELGDSGYLQQEDYNHCFHPDPNWTKTLTRECYAGLTALAQYTLKNKKKKKTRK